MDPPGERTGGRYLTMRCPNRRLCWCVPRPRSCGRRPAVRLTDVQSSVWSPTRAARNGCKLARKSPFETNGLFLHEPPGIVLRFGAEYDDGRPDAVLAPPGENHSARLGCIAEALVVLGGDTVVGFGPCGWIRRELRPITGMELVQELGLR